MNRSGFDAARIAKCRHFGTCGGCDALDVAYDRQLVRKGAEVRRLFASLDAAAVRDLEVVPSPQVHRYRNKVIYPVRAGGSRGVEAGFFRVGTHELVDIQECQVQERCLTASLDVLRTALIELHLEPYDESSGRGLVRALFGRIATGTGELMLGIVTRGGAFPLGAELARRVARACEGLETERKKRVHFAGFMHSLHDAPGNRLLGERNLALLGRPMLRERLGRLQLEISMNSFYQVNASATVELYQRVDRALGAESVGRVVEAYAGIGSLALWIAPRASDLWTIEVSRSAVRDARRNFALAGRSADQVLEGTVEERLRDIEGSIDVLIVDPPRAGLSPAVLSAVIQRLPERLIYVSCNAATLVRDAEALLRAGYFLRPLEAVDLFPHTPHVELLATFVRTKSSS